MKEVYVVTTGRVLGVYTDKDKAERVNKIFGGKENGFSVVSAPLDVAPPAQKRFYVFVRKNGEIEKVSLASPAEYSSEFGIVKTEWDSGAGYTYSVWADDIEQAVKIVKRCLKEIGINL